MQIYSIFFHGFLQRRYICFLFFPVVGEMKYNNMLPLEDGERHRPKHPSSIEVISTTLATDKIPPAQLKAYKRDTYAVHSYTTVYII